MWSKITNALKYRPSNDDQSSSFHQSDVISRVLEQHPNMSVFHGEAETSIPVPSPPASPSKNGRRSIFRRTNKGKDDDSIRAPSPSPLALGLPKVKSSLDLISNESQRSLSRATVERPDMGHHPSQDLLRPSMDAGRSSPTALPRSSLDILNKPQNESLQPSHNEDPNDPRYGSVRSILREPNTPGTGQNVRFFSRDAYKVISPDQSMDSDSMPIQHLSSQSQSQSPPDVINRLQELSSRPNILGAIPRSVSSSKAGHPSLSEVFSPIGGVSTSISPLSLKDNASAPLASPSAPNNSNIFDVSQDIQLSDFAPPGLSFSMDEPSLAKESDTPASDVAKGGFQGKAMTSTPFANKGKGKERAAEVEEEKENAAPVEVDEAVFHGTEKSPRLPAPFHDRSQSFSFGQTVFFSMDDKSKRSSNASTAPSVVSDDVKNAILANDSPHSSNNKSRSRALSDTVFQSLMKSTSSVSSHVSSKNRPEADINDESSADLVVYSEKVPEPDPFSAGAKTYYTPQTNIPITPPRGAPSHVRTASKEDNVIFSLQTQLSLQQELCGQYETDLCARDELVDILGKKLAEVEKEDTKRKGVLRAWKKKVAELEKTCRYLEDEVDSARQESFERSMLDTCSEEALTALQKRIVDLEREKASWRRMEDMFREEVATLETLVKERSDDVMRLKEALWTQEEEEKRFEKSLRPLQEEVEQLGNVSIVFDDEFKKHMMEKEKEQEGEKEQCTLAQAGWDQERQELHLAIEGLEIEKAVLKSEAEASRKDAKDDQDELCMLKSELESQWCLSEAATEKIQTLETAKVTLERQCGALQVDISELNAKIDRMEVDYNDSVNKRAEVEQQVSELWDRNADLERERDELHQRLEEEEHAADLSQCLHERDEHIAALEQEHDSEIARLGDELRKRDEEAAEYGRRNTQRQAELEELHSQKMNMRQEMVRMQEQHTRALEESARRESESKARTEIVLKEKAQDVGALKDEVERLGRHLQELQQDSANKDLKLTQMHKEREKDRSDVDGLNMALDAKQQELELMKRKLQVQGTAGSTPARPAANQANSQRRQSALVTPRSRPPSVMSDSGRESVMSISSHTSRPSMEKVVPSAIAKTPIVSKTAALMKSARMNSLNTPTPASSSSIKAGPAMSKPSRNVEGSMGPPPDKLRRSLSGAPGRLPSLSRSTSGRASLSTSTSSTPHRRPSLTLEKTLAKVKVPTTAPGSVASVSEGEEKENKSQVPTFS
ncbi:uncharacterized protein BT62DRAFT_948399 [Guyanagaster necrorhizus]|uniref:Uncharacterized protein n=1 Tax=Guyanagaster necrorhizus TaxID=856835 RepID=A0A9P8ATT7_9AGAR|nr:uncharacterized protein BT62DRAFT_948399 [Guyanagaster necrorhizus MCA 3950]KAG7447351.1 hypothetical protein BT62DRAFT_948399 [Guyanagaster necrorhizus MCA 3950]